MVFKQKESQHWYVAMPESNTPSLMKTLPQMTEALMFSLLKSFGMATLSYSQTFTTHHSLTARLDAQPSRRITLSLPV